MKICIDARIPNKGGIRTYTTQLLNNLLKIDKKNEYFVFYDYAQGKRGFKNVVENLVPGKNKLIWILWSQINLPLFLKKNKIDVFHSFKHVGALWAKTKTILTIHDAGPFLYPEAWCLAERIYWQTMFKLAGNKMDCIITVSEAAKKTIQQTLNLPLDKIKVTYNGIEHDRFKPTTDITLKQKVREKYKLPEKFIFWVGLMFKTKNVETLIKAYARIKQENNIKHKLILGGRKGNSYPELKKLALSLHLEEEVIFPGFIADEDLPVVYNLADVFVFPSLHEGFGIPPLEAMACLTPVIASNTYALPEVLKDAGLLFDPYNEKELSAKLGEVLQNKNLRELLKTKGIQQSKLFTFKKCAQETLKIYEDIAKS